MTDPYMQINGTKIEVFDNDLSAVKSIKQLDEDTTLKSKIITATRDLTALGGDVSYTGLDFTPTSIICIAAIQGVYGFSMGIADSSKVNAAVSPYKATDVYITANLIHLAVGTTGGDYQDAVIKTFDANVGLTLTWIKTGSPTGTAQLKFLCFR